MKDCKHCFKSYRDCSYYKNGKCTYEKERSFLKDLKAFELLYELELEEEHERNNYNQIKKS